MATKPSLLNRLPWLMRGHHASQHGFTLIELLVAMIIGSAIMGSLLFLVVELMQMNRREEVLTQTQQDMQRAIDYISRDAREAVFVYSTPGAIVNPDNNTHTLLRELGITVNAAGVVTAPTGLAGSIPILAFWRLDPVPVDNGIWGKTCSSAFSGAKANECTTLRLRQSFYTLVLYFHQPNDANSIWGGPSRILRYELPKYSSQANIANLVQTQGYSDPTGCTTFENWSAPPGRNASAPCDKNNEGTPNATIAVLTDYVNFATLTPAPACAGVATPATNPQGFMACVNSGVMTPGEVGANQTLRIFLQGNATEGRPGLVNTFSEAGRLPTLEAEVLVRGVLNKQPSGAAP